MGGGSVALDSTLEKYEIWTEESFLEKVKFELRNYWYKNRIGSGGSGWRGGENVLWAEIRKEPKVKKTLLYSKNKTKLKIRLEQKEQDGEE